MKTLGFIVKYIVAAIVAVGMAVGAEVLICEIWNVGYWAAPMVVFVMFGVVGMYLGEWLAERAFDAIRRRQAEREDIVRFRRGLGYRQAAILVGGVCLFMGEPNVCDDLWHRGVQAEVKPLTGEETFNVL